MKKYVIIGNSIAAAGCVEGIRQHDKKGEITIIGNENHHVYSRPLISYLLEGKTDEQRMKYRPDNFYELNNCSLINNEKAVKINAVDKYIILESGKNVPYDKLLVATGSSPFVPPCDGYDKVKNKHTFFTLDDALALEKCVNKKSKVLIVGAGLIGLKCAECLRDRAETITVVDMAPKVLSSILDEDASAIIKKHLEDNGIKLFLSDSVKKFTEKTATLASGSTLDFDVLVMAVGVRANTSLVKDAGGVCTRGITVDSKCKTSLTDVFAAGDCTESTDCSDGNIKVMALLPNAYMQGECAGINMSGHKYEFTKAIPENSLGLFGLHMMTAGNYVGDVYTKADGNEYKKLFYKGNKLNGFIIIGDVSRVGIYTSLIREKTPLDTIDFPLVCENPCLMAFTSQARSKMLGGEK